MQLLHRFFARKDTHRVVKTATPLLIASLALYVWLFHPGLVYVLADSLTYNSPDGTYQYSTMHSADGPIELQVTFDLNDAAAVERYRQANQARAQTLLESATGEKLWTTLTFVKPLSLSEMSALLQAAQLKPASYTQVGWDKAGGRMGSTIFRGESPDFDLKQATKEAISSDPNTPDYGATMAGFMLVDGYITISQESLGKLLHDPRVYIVDTTAHEVMQVSQVSEGKVVLSTPFWNMDWGVTQSGQKLFLPQINN